MLSLSFLVEEVNDKEPTGQAFVAINYSPKIGRIGTYIHVNVVLMFCINSLMYSRSLYSYFK
jgi:hypothetical protein